MMTTSKEITAIDDTEIQKHVRVMQNALNHLLQLRNQSEQHASIIGNILCDTAKQTIDLIKGENISNQQTSEVTQDRKIGTNSNAALFTESQRLNSYGLPMTVLEMQVDDMLIHGVHSVLPNYAFYTDRQKLECAPDGAKRIKPKKDTPLEHLLRYFGLYLRCFNPKLIELGEEPLYMFQMGKIDQKLYRALVDFAVDYPDQIPCLSDVVPNKFQSGNKNLERINQAPADLTKMYEAKANLLRKRKPNKE